MSQSPSSSKKMLDSLNEIDPVAFYTSSDVLSPSKMPTISPVNITKSSPLTPSLPLISITQHPHINLVPILPCYLTICLRVIFLRTPEVGAYPSSDSIDTDKDNIPLKWSVQRIMVPISTKGKEKVTKETPRKRPFTRAISQKLMGDAIKSSETTTAENRRRRKSGDAVFEMPNADVVDVSIEVSEHECVGEDSPLGKQVKKTSKRKPKASISKRGDPTKEKGPKGNKVAPAVSKQTIVNNLRLQRVLGGWVFDLDIITKPGMDSLYDLVEIQSWTHLFQIKSPVLHEEEVRESYYNIEFAEDGSINTRVGEKSLHLDEDLLGQILEKLIKGEYQLMFEFVNKVLRPRTEKTTAASATDLFIMESICKFEPIDLPALMMEYMYKSVIEHKGKHVMGYGYFLTKVFHHFNIPVGTDKIDQLKHEREEMTVRVSNKDAEIALLKAKLLKAQTEGPGTAEVKELRKQNDVLLAQIAAL
ncbi:hypothetical protein KY284_036073 [Solanum tuberosum]|nr:hypothetical protein KY284_036073 [Solanum tuberosum]